MSTNQETQNDGDGDGDGDGDDADTDDDGDDHDDDDDDCLQTSQNLPTLAQVIGLSYCAKHHYQNLKNIVTIIVIVTWLTVPVIQY